MKTITITVTLAILAFATPALAAPDCSTTQLISQHVQWLNAAKQNVVRVTAVSNQNNRLASYAEGELAITGQPFPGAKAVTYLGGTLEQFFSDRRYGLPSKGGVEVPQYPFSPKSTDKVSLSVTSEGSVSLSLKSWNNAVLKLTDVRCAAGVLYGFTDNASGPKSFYLISMARDVRRTPVVR
jgi:hypothetical protein